MIKYILVVMFFIVTSLQIVVWRSRPIQEVSHPACKELHRDEHPDFCKIPLPTIQQDTFIDQYSENEMLRLIYTMPWWSPYHTPTAFETGSHPSLDVASAKGTPIYAIWPGKVLFVWKKSWYGNVVTIQHQFGKKIIYSNYSHLDTFHVSKWDQISEKQLIWTMGNSGFAMGKYGNHLDFQLTTAESPHHPYGFWGCSNSTYIDVINQWLCQDELHRFTINPLQFFTETDANRDTVRTTTDVLYTRMAWAIATFFQNRLQSQP